MRDFVVRTSHSHISGTCSDGNKFSKITGSVKISCSSPANKKATQQVAFLTDGALVIGQNTIVTVSEQLLVPASQTM